MEKTKEVVKKIEVEEFNVLGAKFRKGVCSCYRASIRIKPLGESIYKSMTEDRIIGLINEATKISIGSYTIEKGTTYLKYSSYSKENQMETTKTEEHYVTLEIEIETLRVTIHIPEKATGVKFSRTHCGDSQ